MGAALVQRLRSFVARSVSAGLELFVHLLTAVRAIWEGCEPVPEQRVYFANHTSNGDFMLIWAVLPPELRRITRPVAGSDYWLTSKLREFVGREVVRAVLVDRVKEGRQVDPMDTILEAVDEGTSLIIFPEGKRNMTEEPLLPFKSGIYNISRQRPHVDMIPVWIENLNSVMPKGKIVPIPLLCTVTFGAPMRVEDGEARETFLERAQAALLSLRPERAE